MSVIFVIMLTFKFLSSHYFANNMQRLHKDLNSRGARTVKIPGNVGFQHSEGAHYSKMCLILEIPGGHVPPWPPFLSRRCVID